jgi:hypothetical protein
MATDMNMTPIKLTSKGGPAIFLYPGVDPIIRICPDHAGSQVVTRGGAHEVVREGPEEVQRKLDEWTASRAPAVQEAS